VIHSIEDKARYSASETEEFNIKISKNKMEKLKKGVK
jgi:hypothetical protein